MSHVCTSAYWARYSGHSTSGRSIVSLERVERIVIRERRPEISGEQGARLRSATCG